MTDSLVAPLRARAAQHPQRAALIFLEADGRVASYSYGQLDLDARRYAGLLRVHGVQPSDQVIVAFEHGYDLVAAFWGALYHGAAPTIFPYADATGSGEARRRRLADLAAFTSAQAVLCPSAAQAEAASWLAGQATRALALAEDAGPVAEGLLSPRSGEEIAYIQFSSGATGAPKGVMLSHRAVLANVRGQIATLSFNDRDVCVHWLPFYHDMGLLGTVILPLLSGALSVSMAPAAWIRRPQLLFSAIDRYRGTMTWMPNFAFNHCLRTIRDEHLAGLDLSSWRILGNGSEPVQASSLRRFAERFAPWGLNPAALTVGYGMAENVVVISMTPLAQAPRADFVAMTDLQAARRATPVSPEQPGAKAIASCGLPLPGVQVRVVDEAGQPLPERHAGEIAVAGPSLFSGYFGDAARTAQTLRDGWFHTGDLGYLADGELYVCDRLKDLIIIGGRNIFPESIEALAREVFGEQVRHVAAFGVPDEALGTELAVLVCELRGSPNDETETQLAEQVRERVLAELDVALADVCFARGLVARTTSGKVARSATRVNYLAAGYRPQPPTSILSPALLADPVALEAALLALASQILGVATVRPDDNFFDLGGDSLTALRFILAVEETTGQSVPTEFFQEPTVSHLAHLLGDDQRLLPARRFSAAAPSPEQPVNQRRARSWRRDLFTLPQRMRVRVRTMLEAPAFRRPYFEGIRWLMDWCGQSWVQRLFYPRESQLVRRFAASMGTPAAQVAQEVALNLVGNIILSHWVAEGGLYAPLRQTQSLLLAELAKGLEGGPANSRWPQYVSVEGAPHLTQAVEADAGVIIVGVHSPTRYVPRYYLSHWRIPTVTFSRQEYLRRMKRLNLHGNGGWSAARASVARDGYDVLAQGGLAMIAGDKQNAQNGIPAIIGDRLHRLSPGFAELAVAADAAVLSLHSALMLDGRVRIEISPPLEWDRSIGGGEQVTALVQAYAGMQTAIWRARPSAVSKEIMAQHLAQPKATVHDD